MGAGGGGGECVHNRLVHKMKQSHLIKTDLHRSALTLVYSSMTTRADSLDGKKLCLFASVCVCLFVRPVPPRNRRDDG